MSHHVKMLEKQKEKQLMLDSQLSLLRIAIKNIMFFLWSVYAKISLVCTNHTFKSALSKNVEP